MRGGVFLGSGCFQRRDDAVQHRRIGIGGQSDGHAGFGKLVLRGCQEGIKDLSGAAAERFAVSVQLFQTVRKLSDAGDERAGLLQER